jgi:hypothetical protein
VNLTYGITQVAVYSPYSDLTTGRLGVAKDAQVGDPISTLNQPGSLVFFR